MNGYRDLQLVSVAAIVCALVALLSPLHSIALIAALPLCLALPGYAMAAALFAAARPDAPRLWLLTLALSLSILVLGSLLLNFLPGGIRATTWAALLVVAVLAAARVAAVRRRGRRLPRRPRQVRLAAPGRLDAVLFGVGVLTAGAALTLAQTIVPAKQAEGFTALWVLAGNNGRSVEVGIDSNQQARESYRLFVRTKPNGGVTKIISLAPGEERVFRLPVEPPEASYRVTASLYREGDLSHVYRRASTWLPKGESGR